MVWLYFFCLGGRIPKNFTAAVEPDWTTKKPPKKLTAKDKTIDFSLDKGWLFPKAVYGCTSYGLFSLTQLSVSEPGLQRGSGHQGQAGFVQSLLQMLGMISLRRIWQMMLEWSLLMSRQPWDQEESVGVILMGCVVCRCSFVDYLASWSRNLKITLSGFSCCCSEGGRSCLWGMHTKRKL